MRRDGALTERMRGERCPCSSARAAQCAPPGERTPSTAHSTAHTQHTHRCRPWHIRSDVLSGARAFVGGFMRI
eukprot:3483628-Prymnesium_polylepis.1